MPTPSCVLCNPTSTIVAHHEGSHPKRARVNDSEAHVANSTEPGKTLGGRKPRTVSFGLFSIVDRAGSANRMLRTAVSSRSAGKNPSGVRWLSVLQQDGMKPLGPLRLGKLDFDRRADANFALDGQLTAVQLRQSACQDQSKPEPLLFIDLAVELHKRADFFDL
jgi:hypothetical protein